MKGNKLVVSCFVEVKCSKNEKHFISVNDWQLSNLLTGFQNYNLEDRQGLLTPVAVQFTLRGNSLGWVLLFFSKSRIEVTK